MFTNEYSTSRDAMESHEYATFLPLVEAAIAPAVWRMLTTQRWCDTPATVWRRIIGVGYRALYGWAVVPATFPRFHADGVGCTCLAGRVCNATGKHPIGAHGMESIPDAPPVDWLARMLTHPGDWVHRDMGANANLAILTGQRSGGLIVGDADPRNGATLKTLLDAGWPQETVIERSGSGGAHIFARWPYPGVVPNGSNYLAGVDALGDGKLVIVSPSAHVSGGFYSWLSGHAPWQREVATLPESVAQDILTRAPERSDRVASAGEYDITDPNALTYSWPETLRRVGRVFASVLAKIEDGAHRSDMAFELGLRLSELRLTTEEIDFLGDYYTKAVRDGGE